MDRDTLLAAALGAAVLGGCTTARDPEPVPLPTPSPTPDDPDVAVLTRWLDAERRLADRYAAAVRPVPEVATLRGNHLARAAAVIDHLRARGAAVPTPTARPPLRGRAADVLAALARAERELAAAYVAALAAVDDTRVAVLGAELAAGARQHALVLGLVRP